MGPSDDVCLELVRRLRTSAQLQHAWTTQTWEVEHGLHPAAAGLLAEIAHRGECRATELAKRRMVDVSVISRQVAQLVSAGLIERRPAPDDGRAALLRPSEQGRAELRRWRSRHVAFVRRALEGWHEDAVVSLVEQLDEINDDLRAVIERGSQGGADQARDPSDHQADDDTTRLTETGQPTTVGK